MLCFNNELLNILSPEDVIYLSVLISDDNSSESDFLYSSTYEKLLSYYLADMPYGIAKCRTGEPDIWILDKVKSML